MSTIPTTVSDTTTLADLTERIKPSGDWTLTHKTPEPCITNGVDTPELRLTHPDRFDRHRQSHDAHPVTGVQLAITNDDGRYETRYRVLLNTARVSGSRVVVTSSLTEALEWLTRLYQAVTNTPNGWVLAPRDSLEMLRWLTLNGSHELAVWQQDRNNLEARQYDVIHTTPADAARQAHDRSELEVGLTTDQLFDTVTPHLTAILADDQLADLQSNGPNTPEARSISCSSTPTKEG